MSEPIPGTAAREALLDQADAAVTDLADRIARMVDQGTYPPDQQTGGPR